MQFSLFHFEIFILEAYEIIYMCFNTLYKKYYPPYMLLFIVGFKKKAYIKNKTLHVPLVPASGKAEVR